MKFTSGKLVLVILIAAALTVGLTLGLQSQGTQQTKRQSSSVSNFEQPQTSSMGHSSDTDYPIFPNLTPIAARSDFIVKGRVLLGREVSIDLGGRSPIPYSIYPVEIINVFKGTAPGNIITVGQRLDEELPNLEPGTQVYLFLSRAQRSPYEYFFAALQGHYFVRAGIIEPKAPAWLPTTKQFNGMKEGVFVEELRRAIGSQ